MLVETGGKAVTCHMPSVTSNAMANVLKAQVDPASKIVTVENKIYRGAIRTAGIKGGHETVNHSNREYVRQSDGINTNTAESYFALIKRGHYGVYHQMSKKHLHRYCDEFGFRWNGRTLKDTERRDAAVCGAEGKRLYYKTPVK